MLTIVLVNLCLVFCHALTVKPDFGPSQTSFVPSMWNEMIAAASQQVGSSQNVPEPRLAEGRAYGTKRRGYGGHKHQSFMTELDIDPTPIKLVCKVQEPLEHIIWVLSRCPGHSDYGHHPDRLIAEGATVTDKSNYDVRIIGANSTITSELLVKNPLSPSGSGVYRCEAWPHGGGGPPYGQYVAHDIFIIGGKDLLKSCFGGWDTSPPEPSGWASFAAKSGSGNSKVRGDFKNQYPRFNYSSSASNKVEVKVHRDGYDHDDNDYDEERQEEEQDPALKFPPARHTSGGYSALQQQYNRRYRPQTLDRVYSHRQSNDNNQKQLYQSATTTSRPLQLVFSSRPSGTDNQDKEKYATQSKQNENSRFEPLDSNENLSPETQSLIKEYYNYILNQQNQDGKNQQNYRQVNSKFDSSKVVTDTPTTDSNTASTVPARYYIVPTSTATPAFSQNPSPREPIYPFSSARQSKAEEKKPTTESVEIWNADDIMKKSPSFARVESRSSKALYGWKHGENGTVEKMEENVTPEVVTVLPTKQENVTEVKSVEF